MINYLPEWLRDFSEMKKLARAEQDQAEKLWKSCESIWDNNFIDTLDSRGCDRWEAMLHIKPKDSYTLAERRNNIKSRVVEQRPFTVKKLRQMLEAICGAGKYELIWYSTYRGCSCRDVHLLTIIFQVCRLLP